MTATLAVARDDILDTFKTAWDANGTSAVVPVIYFDTGDNEPPAPPNPFARVTVRHVAVPNQQTIGSVLGQKRYVRRGNVFVQIFTAVGDGLVLSDELALIARKAFEGNTTTVNGVVFRNVNYEEVGPDGGWFQVNVISEFEYHEIF